MARFDDRLPPRGKDGDDFQRFVWEALRSGHFQPLLGGRYVRLYFASGRDGAIDHVAIGSEDQIIFECKFFGKDRRDQPAGDWTKVADKLGRNLRANAEVAIDSVSLSYKPWFDKDRPIQGYWFCTSAILSPGAQTDLRRSIKGFFAGVASDHRSLAHLATIDVEVLGWNDFDGALAAKPSLHFSWFRRLPVGLRPLRSITEGKVFRKFLEDGTLPFFSREAFNREFGFENQASFTDEKSILSTLLDGNDQPGLVLSGPGGLGKTRLALQLGVDAGSNWLVFHVERNTLREAIEELAREHVSPAQMLLIIDYAEAVRSLFELAQEMERANSDGGHRFRFIATCRASALSVVKEALEESAYQIIEFSGKPDDRYANWVVNRILATAEIPHADDIAPVCRGLPVLAAFAVFLFEQYPENFDAQFGQIHHGDDFAKWADKRLKLALDAQGLEDRSTRRLLAAIAARLPLSAEEHYALRGLNNMTVRLLDLLQADRWIESDGESIAAAHDVFADAIIARYIFESERTITDRVGDVLSDAMDAGAFDRALIAVNRLAAQQWFNEIDGLAVIKRVHARNPAQVVAAHQLLLKTKLPDDRTCIHILDAMPDVADAVAADMSCDGLVSYLAEATATSKDDGWRDKATLVLQPFLDRAVERPHRSNMVVRRALRLLPTRYRDQALAWIRREPTRLETHFLLVAWLRSGLPLEEITADVEVWLVNEGKTDSKASFVFSAWFDAAAKLDQRDCADKTAKVETHVLAWLDTHGKSEVAQFVYNSWLDAAAKLDQRDCAEKIAEVETHVLAWLDKHRTFEVAGFVYQPWLDAAAKLDQRDCAEKIAKVETHLLAWLDKHGKFQDAGFVYKSWLDAATKLDPKEAAAKIAKVETHVLAWLDTYRTSDVARFVHKPWLDAAAKLDQRDCAEKIAKVETHLLAWLNKHGTAEDASFVYTSWLNAGGSDLIRASMIAWLSANSGHQKSDFIIKAWLKATRDFATVRIPALSWLKQNTKNLDAVFLLKYVCRERDLPSDAIEDAISWCTHFPNNLDSICRIGALLSRYGVGTLEKALIDAALLILEQVQENWLGDKGVRDATLATIGSLAWKSRFLKDIEPRLDLIHANVLLSASAYSANLVVGTQKFVLNPALAQHVAGMVERKIIDPKADLSALERFADWLAAWPVDRKPMLRPALHALEQRCPIAGLWSRVGVIED